MGDYAFDYAPVGLCELENRIIRRCNRLSAEIYGGQVADYPGTPVSTLYPSREEYELIGTRGRAVMAESGFYQDERIMRRLDGTLFWCRVRGRSLSPDDPFSHGIWSFSDLSDERPVVALTPREREVAMLTARGFSAKEVAAKMGLSHRTVEAHRAKLLAKFEARKLPELVAKLTGMPL